jgi:hypothetical protein
MLELKPVVNLQKLPTNYPHTSKLIRLDCSHILIPKELADAVIANAVRLDYDYMGSERTWKLHKSQVIPNETLSQDQLLALRVAQKLEN